MCVCVRFLFCFPFFDLIGSLCCLIVSRAFSFVFFFLLLVLVLFFFFCGPLDSSLLRRRCTPRLWLEFPSDSFLFWFIRHCSFFKTMKFRCCWIRLLAFLRKKQTIDGECDCFFFVRLPRCCYPRILRFRLVFSKTIISCRKRPNIWPPGAFLVLETVRVRSGRKAMTHWRGTGLGFAFVPGRDGAKSRRSGMWR